MSVNTFDPKQASTAPTGKQSAPAASATDSGSSDISVTSAAHTHISAQLQRSGAANVRLGVKESGCNGYMYTLDFVDEPSTTDLHITITDATHGELMIVVSPADIALVGGTQIDLVTEGLNSALRFKNPNAESHCGCGESFSVAQA